MSSPPPEFSALAQRPRRLRGERVAPKTHRRGAEHAEVSAEKTSTMARALSQLNQRFLAAVKAEYGPDSNEFALLGAIHLGDRKKPVRPPKTKAG